MSLRLGVLSVFIVLVASGCRKDEGIVPYVPATPHLPEGVYDYEGRTFPAHFFDGGLLGFIWEDNQVNKVTNDGATLGRVLFYDKELSLNRTVSCGTCHHQDKGFTDGLAFSEGFMGGLTDRNSMSIVNTEFQQRFFWDSRADSIEMQVLMPIEHPVEMGMNFDNLLVRMKDLPYYPALFEKAFGSSDISVERIALALGQFINSIRSFESKYDVGRSMEFANFTEEELLGRDIFVYGGHGCVNCHFTENFGGLSNNVNGLDLVYEDKGRWEITGEAKDKGKFKSVSLRNIELTGPYMHDGRFETLEEVIGFYSNQVQQHPNLDDRLTTDFTKGGNPRKPNFTEAEIQAVVAFLKTLTDWSLINNPAFSDPFE